MIQKIFSVYDQKAHAYLPPFFLPQRGMAVRVFTDCVNAKDHQFGLHPADYTLFELGQFDDNTAKITVAPVPSVVGTGVEFVKVEPQPLKTDLEDDQQIGDEP